MNTPASSPVVDSFASLKPKTGFLRPADETFMLAIPTIGILASVVMLIVQRANHGVSPFSFDDVASLFTTLIFMDGVHVTFTFMLLMMIPELRTWSFSNENRPKEGTWDKGRTFWTRMAIIAGLLALVVFTLRISATSSVFRGMMTIWLFLELLGPSQHTAAQMRGISFVYNSTLRRAYQFTAEESARAVAAEKAERLLFKAVITGDVLYWIPRIFVADRIHIPGIRYVQLVGALLAGVGAIGLVLNSFRYPRNEETDKSFFLSRVLLFPFKILTPVAGLAIRATHGTEYLMIFRRLVQSSKIADAKKRRVYAATIAVSVIYGLVFLAIWPATTMKLIGISAGKTIFMCALLVTFVVRFTHYYMDALLFKMSDPMTRAAVSPLLVPVAAKPREGAEAKPVLEAARGSLRLVPGASAEIA